MAYEPTNKVRDAKILALNEASVTQGMRLADIFERLIDLECEVVKLRDRVNGADNQISALTESLDRTDDLLRDVRSSQRRKEADR